MADEEKKGLSTLGDKERADVYEVAKIIPDLQVDLKHFVEDEEEIAEKDTVTLQVRPTPSYPSTLPQHPTPSPLPVPHIMLRTTRLA